MKSTQDSSLKNAIDAANSDLNGSGRVFSAPSGTEPLIWLLVECNDAKTAASDRKVYPDDTQFKQQLIRTSLTVQVNPCDLICKLLCVTIATECLY